MNVVYKALLSITGVAVVSIVIHFVFHAIFHVSLRSKPVARLIGVAVASLGAFLFITFYSELQTIPDQPERISIEKISEQFMTTDRLWGSISDATWDCNNMGYSGNNTYAVLLNKDSSFFIVASFDEEMTCEELRKLQPAGSISKFVDREFIYTSNYIDFSRYGETATYLSLCAYCGRKNTQLGMVMGLVFLVLGLFYDKVAITPFGNKTRTTTLPPQPRDLMN